MGLIRIAALALLAAVLTAACGGTGGISSTSSASPGGGAGPTSTATTGAGQDSLATPSTGNPSAFAWLRPAPPPPAWPVLRLSGTARLAYPPTWKRIHTDPGTASAARIDARAGLVTEYLNATPRQGDETLQNWSTFRPAHNGDEGDRHVQLLAAAQGLRFRNGRGSCVIDRYRTSRTSYQEIACLVRGPAGQSVIVAAAQAARWAQAAPALERAVSAFVA